MNMISKLKDIFTSGDPKPSDLDLADLGMSRLDFNRLARSKPGTRARMEKMAARFGVTPAMIDGNRGLAMELAQTCGNCLNAQACQNAMDLSVDFEASRCPNSSVYADMSPT